MPTSSNATEAYKDLSYLSQTVHAHCVTLSSSHFRLQRGSAAGTMGLMFWSLNNQWQGQSDASIDYTGRSPSVVLPFFGVGRSFHRAIAIAPDRSKLIESNKMNNRTVQAGGSSSTTRPHAFTLQCCCTCTRGGTTGRTLDGTTRISPLEWSTTRRRCGPLECTRMHTEQIVGA